MPRYLLKLYVAEVTSAVERAIQVVRGICAEDGRDCEELVVVDIRRDPQLAEEARILATPTLVRETPPPVRRVIGDLTDREKVILGLDLQSGPNGSAAHTTHPSNGAEPKVERA